MHPTKLTTAWAGFFPLSMLEAEFFIDMLSTSCKIQDNQKKKANNFFYDSATTIEKEKGSQV